MRNAISQCVGYERKGGKNDRRFDRYSVYCSKDLQIAAHSVDELRSVLYNTIAYIMRYYVDSM